MRFMLIMVPEVYRHPVSPNFKPDLKAIEKMSQFNEKLREAGVLLALDGLTPPAAGARVSFVGSAPHLTKGPFAGTEAVGGYWMIRVDSQQQAVEWAKRCPANPNDVIEVRRVHDPEDFRSSTS